MSSLSWEARSAPARLRTTTPRAASEPKRPEAVLDAVEAVDDVEPAGATAPGCRRRRLLREEDARVDPRGTAAARAVFVAVRRWATIASSIRLSIAENPAAVGYRTVKIRCRVWLRY